MKVKNWKSFQHYSHRRPPWIKLHRTLLDNMDWHNLEPGAAKTLITLWLLASEEEDGKLPSPEEIAFRLRLPLPSVIKHLAQLLAWIEQDASPVLAEGKQNVTTETETEKSRDRVAEASSADAVSFQDFWNAYPRKVKKANAAKAWKLHVKNGDGRRILQALEWQVRSEEWTKEGGAFIPHPTSYINGRRWEDERVTTHEPVAAERPGKEFYDAIKGTI